VDFGATLLAVYLELAACAGLSNPKPPPTIVIQRGEWVRCPDVTPDGKCSGLHRGHRILVTYGTTDALRHELLHDVLCQLGDCDPRHQRPEWTRCMP